MPVRVTDDGPANTGLEAARAFAETSGGVEVVLAGRRRVRVVYDDVISGKPSVLAALQRARQYDDATRRG